ELVVEGHTHTLPRTLEVQDPLIALIAVLLEDHALYAQLHSFWFIGATGNVRPLAALVVDRHKHVPLAFDQVHLGDQAKPIGGKRDRTGVDTLPFFSLFRSRQVTATLIHAPMHVPPLDGIRGIGPLTL